jgi:hypothetical protein
LGRLAKAPEFLRFDARSELRLNQAELGVKLDLSSRCRRDDHCQIETCCERKQKRGQPKHLQGTVPRKKEGTGKPLWKLNKEKQMAHKNKMEHCTNCVWVQRILIIELQISNRNLCEKMFQEML